MIALRQLVKEQAIDLSIAACAWASGVCREKKKGPDPFGIRACVNRSLERRDSVAVLSRMHGASLVAIKQQARSPGSAAMARTRHRPGPCERGQTHGGSGVGGGVAGFHDEPLNLVESCSFEQRGAL